MKKTHLTLTLAALLFASVSAHAQTPIALLKYNGGGDWYANPTSLTNLIAFCNSQLNMNLTPQYATVDIGSSDLLNYPYVHITGHGNITLSAQEADNLRTYLLSGGFLHIDDNYGLKEFAMKQMEKVFPELKWIELPYSHPIFHQKYNFPHGLPKIHEHDNQPPKAYAMFHEGRMVCLFTWECDLGDGWENIDVHNDTMENHLKALQMGANILQFVFTQN
ncbi:MAG: DUF4159 domain-containing protein [Bacteroidales bacterium]|nr:DUF4159 domain-containing protein [Bacteroidales bacterium]